MENTKTLKIPPQNIEAEQSVLGSMILDREQIAIVMEIIRDKHFYRENHAKIFSAITTLFEKGEPVDIITLSGYLERLGAIENVGGITYLSALLDTVPTPLNAKTYATMVYEKAVLRELIKAGNQISDIGYQGNGDLDETIGQCEKTIYNISKDINVSEIIPIKVAVKRHFADLDNKYKPGGIVSGIPTGFLDLDEFTSGLQPSDLIILAARPSMGKTSLALNIVEHAAINERKSVGIFTLEMSAEALVTRLLCSFCEIDALIMRKGFLSQRDWDRLFIGMSTLSASQIYIVDMPGISSTELRTKARRMQREFGVQLIIVDYLQLMSGKQRERERENRVQEVSEISRELKILARELSIPVIALSQLSRAVEQREDKRPRLSDLRESGSIEQDADLVMFIYRADYYKRIGEEEKKGEKKEENRGGGGDNNPPVVRNTTEARDTPFTFKEAEEGELIIAKHRNGPIGKVFLTFLTRYTKFVSSARGREI